MSIASQITAYSDGLADAYDAVAGRGGTIPQRRNLVNLPTAINTIPSGGGGYIGIPKSVDANGVFGPKKDEPFSYTFPSGVTSIGAPGFSNAFKESTVTSIDGKGVSNANIGLAGMCSGCTQLTSVDFRNIPNFEIAGPNDGFRGCTNLVNADFRSVTHIGVPTSNRTLCSGAFRGCTSLTSIGYTDQDSVRFDSLTAIYYDGFNNTFRDCTGLTTVDLSRVTAIEAFQNAFQDCTSLVSLNLSGLVSTVERPNTFNSMCYGCTSLSNVNLSGLRQIGPANYSSSVGNTFYAAFSRCTSLKTITFNSLEEINAPGAFAYAFQNSGIEHIYFPALTTFGPLATNPFGRMLDGRNGATLHFPAAIQSAVESLSNYPNFGGNNTIILFDL